MYHCNCSFFIILDLNASVTQHDDDDDDADPGYTTVGSESASSLAPFHPRQRILTPPSPAATPAPIYERDDDDNDDGDDDDDDDYDDVEDSEEEERRRSVYPSRFEAAATDAAAAQMSQPKKSVRLSDDKGSDKKRPPLHLETHPKTLPPALSVSCCSQYLMQLLALVIASNSKHTRPH